MCGLYSTLSFSSIVSIEAVLLKYRGNGRCVPKTEADVRQPPSWLFALKRLEPRCALRVDPRSGSGLPAKLLLSRRDIPAISPGPKAKNCPFLDSPTFLTILVQNLGSALSSGANPPDYVTDLVQVIRVPTFPSFVVVVVSIRSFLF